jgi:hypothetical protein
MSTCQKAKPTNIISHLNGKTLKVALYTFYCCIISNNKNTIQIQVVMEKVQ